MQTAKPIGIFDSGMGGLTVAREIKKALPNENIIYFGDTMHVPYGDKSKETVVEYSKNIVDFLLSKKCKAIVIACNTASANAFSELQQIMPKGIPLIDVISPVTDHVSFQLYQKIAVVATKATIASNVYKKKIKSNNKHLQVVEMATPLLVPIIEEGFFNSNVSKAAIESYFSSPRLKCIDALVLGCTHYPLISDEIENYFNGSVRLLNSPLIVANAIKRQLVESELICKENTEPTHTFFLSDYTDNFQKQASRFFGKNINLKIKRFS